MSNRKVSNLPDGGVAQSTDIVYVVRDPGGTPTDHKVTVANLLANAPGPSSTSDIPEGSNLYHTSGRVNALIEAALGAIAGFQAFGKSLLTLASAAALRTAVALPTSTTAGRLARYTDAAGAQGQTAGIYEDASGNVGIGTTNATHPLTMGPGKSIRLTDASNTYGAKIEVNDYTLNIVGDGTYPVTRINLLNKLNWFDTSIDIYLIGGESIFKSPLYAKHATYLGFQTYGSTSAFNAIKHNYSNNLESGLSLQSMTGGVHHERLTVLPSGRVGIGTIGPATKLHIQDAATATARIQGDAGAAQLELYGASLGQIHNIGGNHFYIDNATAHDIIFRPGAYTEAMRLMANGNVGIGATGPVAALDVNGAIRAKTYTVATLPAASLGDGMTAFVSDANATLAASLGATVAGGGANFVPVHSRSSNWIVG